MDVCPSELINMTDDRHLEPLEEEYYALREKTDDEIRDFLYALSFTQKEAWKEIVKAKYKESPSADSFASNATTAVGVTGFFGATSLAVPVMFGVTVALPVTLIVIGAASLVASHKIVDKNKKSPDYKRELKKWQDAHETRMHQLWEEVYPKPPEPKTGT